MEGKEEFVQEKRPVVKGLGMERDGKVVGGKAVRLMEGAVRDGRGGERRVLREWYWGRMDDVSGRVEGRG